MKNKKVMISIISVVALLLLLIGITYAYWLLTKMQTNSNIISSACLDITLDNETNDINLTSQYPMSDEDGMKLIPYTFTVTNNCNTSVEYQVALEAIGALETSIASSAIKVALDNNVKLYSNYGEVATTINGAYESRSIGYARLAANGNEGSSASHSLRIWIDENAPISEANKIFQSKISVTIGQGIESPYVMGALANDILENYGGLSTISEIDENQFAHAIVYSGPDLVELYDSLYFGTEYTYDENSGNYSLSGDIVQATVEECRNGIKACGKYSYFSYIIEESSDYIYEVVDWYNTNGEEYVTANHIKYMKTFTFPTTNDEAGLYKAEDDLGTSYYYRGNVTNNYVQFGAYSANATVNGTTFTEATPMYWRIVRINGDGTIRLVYDGTIKSESGVSHNATIGDITYNAEDYINVNYGDSDIKGVIDTWYDIHLESKYDTYIADGIFCNDKEVYDITYLDSSWYETTPDNASFVHTNYAPIERLGLNKAPSLTCTRKEDRYARGNGLGNGQLEYPVGLLNADEVIFAGGIKKEEENFINKNYYLYSGNNFWVSTPYSAEEVLDDSPTEDIADVLFVDNAGLINQSIVLKREYGIRPVINLRADVEFTGNGSFETPYVIKTN